MKHIPLILLLFYCICSNGQEIISGRVVDIQDFKPLEGATITVDGLHSTTNNEGQFKIKPKYKKTRGYNLQCSFVGYKNKEILIKSNFSNVIIRLEKGADSLPEVIVSSGARKIVEKAIEKIPVNYAVKPFISEGIIRLTMQQDNGYFYNSDAAIKIYNYPYTTNKTADVALIKNKVLLQKGKFYDSLHTFRWISAYRTPSIFDFAHNTNKSFKLNKLDRYNFNLTGKEKYEDTKVFVINFKSKKETSDTGRISGGILFIDTANYAFVKAVYTVNNIYQLGFVPIKSSNISVYYKKVNNKYYLNNINSITKYYPRYNITSNSSINYITTLIDTINVNKFKYSEIIQEDDAAQNINNLASNEEWKQYDALFTQAENNNLIAPLETIDTTVLNEQSKSVANNRNKFRFKLSNYIKNEGMLTGIYFSKQPIGIISNDSGIKKTVPYTIGINMQFKLYKTLYVQYGTDLNFGLGKLNVISTSYSLTNKFKFNTKDKRSISIDPFVGYNQIKILNSGKTITDKYRNFIAGITAEWEITHTANAFISSYYNYNISQSNSNVFPVRLNPLSYSIGIIFNYK